MKYAVPVAGALVLIVAVAATLDAWNDRQQVQSAAKNFTLVLDQVRQTQLEPTPAQGSRPSPSRFTGFAALLNALAAEARNFGAESQALDAKLRSIDLGDVLSPSTLTSAEGITAARAKVKAMRALIVQRKKMLQAYMTRMEELLRDASVPEDEKRRAVDSFEQTKPRTKAAYRDLESAQKTVIARTSGILDFARHNLGSTALRNGELQFRTRLQVDQYNLLLERLREAAAAEQQAMASMAAMQEQAKREAETALAKLAD